MHSLNPLLSFRINGISGDITYGFQLADRQLQILRMREADAA